MGSKMKKCRVCKASFKPWQSMQVVCSPGCALEYGKKQNQKAEEKRRKAERKQTREMREALKPIRVLIKEAQTEFNRYIRLRDYHDPCISCGRGKAEVESGTPKVGGYWDAGHYLTRGAHPELRFDESNCHKQCKTCNGGAGQYAKKDRTVQEQYRESLINKIGMDEVERLETTNEPRKWMPDELRAIKKEYRQRANKLKKQLDI